jgi:hypothetical protein
MAANAAQMETKAMRETSVIAASCDWTSHATTKAASEMDRLLRKLSGALRRRVSAWFRTIAMTCLLLCRHLT